MEEHEGLVPYGRRQKNDAFYSAILLALPPKLWLAHDFGGDPADPQALEGDTAAATRTGQRSQETPLTGDAPGSMPLWGMATICSRASQHMVKKWQTKALNPKIPVSSRLIAIMLQEAAHVVSYHHQIRVQIAVPW